MKIDNRILAFAFYVVTVCFIYFFTVTFMPLPSGGSKYADMVVPFLLGSGFGLIGGFYWGSSDGSKQKTELLTKKDSEPKV